MVLGLDEQIDTELPDLLKVLLGAFGYVPR